MYPGTHAAERPDVAAVIMSGSGETLSWRQLDDGSNRLAQLLRARGLGHGDHIAIFTDNCPTFYLAMWAAYRAGLYWTPINWHLTADEAAYIADDCGARALIASVALLDVSLEMVPLTPKIESRLVCNLPEDGVALPPGHESYEEAVALHPAQPVADEREGMQMMYSSGTTGRPKGILPPLLDIVPGDPHPLMSQSVARYDKSTIYLSPAPLYHAAPSVTSSIVHRYGGTVVCMERFDAEACLAAIEKYRVTHTQLVPVMFVRMLKLPEAVRARYDLSSLESVLHAAAPCPVEIKRQMLDWWGPIIGEYYAGSENSGSTMISAEEWLAHPGSVGRATNCAVHILDDDGVALPAGEIGAIWFESPNPRFQYHNDPAKTAGSYNEQGWSTLGDVGYLDDEGYLFLTDRKAFMIISGGVNIYPQEAENLLITHPKVMDVAVVGVPNDEMGEEVKAVVQAMDPQEAGPALAEELLAWIRERLAHYKCPRSIDFDPALPRLENGKLYKRSVKDRYWGERESRIL